MARRRDPVEKAAEGSLDLYDVATWENRSFVDGLSAALWRLLVTVARGVIILLAFLILLGIGGLAALTDPEIGALTLLSAIPALGLAGYVWYSDVTENEPLSLLVGTFLLGVLTANFAAVLNSTLQPLLAGLGFVGTVIFFYLVVGPVEESVKLLAVRLYAYRKERFNAVVDGAVYGAMAGLGFAVIENALYITQSIENPASLEFGLGLIGMGGSITAVRALAGPGHVIYSGIAGYYLGLAKFNPEDAGPIIVKGLVIASLIHATYNATVGIGAAVIAWATGLGGLASFLLYVIIYDGVFGLYLLRKIQRYSKTYTKVHQRDSYEERQLRSESTEFE